MILVQKLYFLPVLLAGFWFGLPGGLFVAGVSSLVYPHRGHGMEMMTSPFFAAGQNSDMLLLFLVGGVTGWLRTRLIQERGRHRTTARERDAALEEVRLSFERASRNDRLAALGEMAAALAHEVRNPLTGMLGAIDILARESDDPTRRVKVIGRIRTEVERLEALVRRFLEYARFPEAVKKIVSPADVVNESVEVVRDYAEKQGHKIENRNDAGAGLIRGDPEQLRQVLVNLLLNAVYFAEPESSIAVSSSFVAGAWSVSVANRGPGIAPEHRKKIFHPFYTTRPEGTGLGLALAERIATAHDGRIVCHSAEETKFTLTLPEVVR